MRMDHTEVMAGRHIEVELRLCSGLVMWSVLTRNSFRTANGSGFEEGKKKLERISSSGRESSGRECIQSTSKSRLA